MSEFLGGLSWPFLPLERVLFKTTPTLKISQDCRSLCRMYSNSPSMSAWFIIKQIIEAILDLGVLNQLSSPSRFHLKGRNGSSDTNWAPTSYKLRVITPYNSTCRGCNPSYPLIRPFIWVITRPITGRGPSCRRFLPGTHQQKFCLLHGHIELILPSRSLLWTHLHSQRRMHPLNFLHEPNK